MNDLGTWVHAATVRECLSLDRAGGTRQRGTCWCAVLNSTVDLICPNVRARCPYLGAVHKPEDRRAAGPPNANT